MWPCVRMQGRDKVSGRLGDGGGSAVHLCSSVCVSELHFAYSCDLRLTYLCDCMCMTTQVAEGSPYYEAFKRAGVEVLFCYQEHDEIVLGNLGKYKDKELKSIEVRTSPLSPPPFSALL